MSGSEHVSSWGTPGGKMNRLVLVTREPLATEDVDALRAAKVDIDHVALQIKVGLDHVEGTEEHILLTRSALTLEKVLRTLGIGNVISIGPAPEPEQSKKNP